MNLSWLTDSQSLVKFMIVTNDNSFSTFFHLSIFSSKQTCQTNKCCTSTNGWLLDCEWSCPDCSCSSFTLVNLITLRAKFCTAARVNCCSFKFVALLDSPRPKSGVRVRLFPALSRPRLLGLESAGAVSGKVVPSRKWPRMYPTKKLLVAGCDGIGAYNIL